MQILTREMLLVERVCIELDSGYIDKACLGYALRIQNWFGHQEEWSWENFWFLGWVDEATEKKLKKSIKKREKYLTQPL